LQSIKTNQMSKSEVIAAQRTCYGTLILLLLNDDELEFKFKVRMMNVITAFIVTSKAYAGDPMDKELVAAMEKLAHGQKALDEIKEFLNNHKN